MISADSVSCAGAMPAPSSCCSVGSAGRYRSVATGWMPSSSVSSTTMTTGDISLLSLPMESGAATLCRRVAHCVARSLAAGRGSENLKNLAAGPQDFWFSVCRVVNLEIWKTDVAPRSARFSGFQFSAAPRADPPHQVRAARVPLGAPLHAVAAHPEWPRRARSRGGHGGPHGPRPRLPCGARGVSSQCAPADALQRPTDSTASLATGRNRQPSQPVDASHA
jgi:hypothetical protein